MMTNLLAHMHPNLSWDNTLAIQYGIKAIRQNLLIDEPTGKIIAKGLPVKTWKKLEGIFTN